MSMFDYMRNPLDRLTPDQRRRHDEVMARATEIFGNNQSAYIWLHRYNSEAFPGVQLKPIEIAWNTDEGQTLVLAELERIAPGITPEPPKQYNSRGKVKGGKWP